MQAVLNILAVLLAMASFVSVLSPLVWVFDLPNHLRPQLLGTSLMLCLVTAVAARTVLRSALAIAVGNGVLFALPLIQALGGGATAPAQDGLRVLTANVWSGNRDHARLLDLVQRTKPDIILLSETNRRWITALSPLLETHPHRMLHPRPGNFGMAAFANRPFEGRLISNPGIAVPMMVLRFDGIAMVNAHPVPPVSGRAHAMNRAYLEEAVAELSSSTEPVLLAGDLNTTFWGDAMAPLLDAGFRSLNQGPLAYTWPSHNPLLAMQIDHVFARGVSGGTLQVLDDIGSDHFPVLAEIGLP